MIKDGEIGLYNADGNEFLGSSADSATLNTPIGSTVTRANTFSADDTY
jgi:hypothetical protein